MKNQSLNQDVKLAEITVTAGDGTVTWDSTDAHNCPSSGSVHVVSTKNGDSSPRVSQCARISPAPSAPSTAYYPRVSGLGTMMCDFETFASTDCTGPSSGALFRVSFETPFWSWNTGPTNILPGAASARLTCWSGGSTNPTQPSNGYVDDFYMGTTPPPAF